MSENKNNKCLNCQCDVNDRPFMYDSATFCSGLCRDAYVRRNWNK